MVTSEAMAESVRLAFKKINDAVQEMEQKLIDEIGPNEHVADSPVLRCVDWVVSTLLR